MTTVTILAIIILLQLIILLTVSVNYFSDKKRYDFAMEMVTEREECFDMAQKLVYEKYNFVLPTSKKYLELAQSRFELEKEHEHSK